eukprot:CCRYP_004212-RA/>CCRYP_004212-RA protein AED:0.29 eAED:0.29 QI:149/1/1/1/1/1/4/239/593
MAMASPPRRRKHGPTKSRHTKNPTSFRRHNHLRHPLSTNPTGQTSSSYGIVFAVQSAESDTVGQSVTSIGFTVDPTLMQSTSFQYEVYALNNEGFYADPDRGESVLSPLTFDYRGQLDQWSQVASGEISRDDLLAPVSTPLSTLQDYYKIPTESFAPTLVPPNAGQRSFYVTLTSAGFISADPGDQTVNEVTALLSGEEDVNTPNILIGESVINYPFDASPYMYLPKAFVGTVYFEKRCTQSPSISIAPSNSPSVLASYSPSGAPSIFPSALPSPAPSFHPSNMPTITSSNIPSTSPTIKAEEVRTGLLLSLELPECAYDANGNPVEMTPEEQDAVVETVKGNVAGNAQANDVDLANVEVIGLNTNCGRRLSGRDGQASLFHRQLPSGSTAVEFSMLITGAYRPPTNPGEAPQPKPRNLDLGTIAEDSINRDSDKFIRDLKERAPASSSLNDVQSLEVEAMEAPPEGAEVVFTRKPTQQPTNPPVSSVIREDGSNSEKSLLLSFIIATTGIILILGSFLIFRYAGRQATKRHEIEIERRKRKKTRARTQGEAHVEWVGDKNRSSSVDLQESNLEWEENGNRANSARVQRGRIY